MALDHGMLMTALNWAYGKAVDGVRGLDSAEELAASYARKPGNPVDQSNQLIRWQVAKAGTSGFITGLGGLLTLPVAIPANVGSVVYLQLRMIAAVAVIGGHRVRDDHVRALAYMCLCGSAAADVVKDMGISIGVKLSGATIKKISGASLTRINQQVGFRLLTKFGTTGVVNLGKALPLVGGVIGGTFDSVSTKTIGNVARKAFVEAA